MCILNCCLKPNFGSYMYDKKETILYSNRWFLCEGGCRGVGDRGLWGPDSPPPPSHNHYSPPFNIAFRCSFRLQLIDRYIESLCHQVRDHQKLLHPTPNHYSCQTPSPSRIPVSAPVMIMVCTKCTHHC